MSLGTVTRSLLKSYRTRFPGASDEHLRVLLLKRFEIAANDPKAKDEETAALADLALDEAAANGEDWAVALKNSFRDNVVRPVVEKATEWGADPVKAVTREFPAVSEEDARRLVDELNSAAIPAQPQAAEDADGEFAGV